MNVIKKTYCLLLVLLYSTILQAQDSRWNVNIYDYQYDMSVYAELQHNGSVITDFTNIEVAAFVGSECRAVGVPQYKDGVRWIYFRVRSNAVSGENVVFKMYDKTEDKEYYLSSEENIEFEANRSLGLPSSPITLLKTVLYSVSASSANEPMGSATVENYVGEAPENSNVIVKATPAIGHSFVEWTNNGKTVSTDNPYTFKITEDTHLVANFKINQYTITFDTDGGSEIVPITQNYNTSITAPANPAKTGYTFAGWDKEIPATMPAENITIKALWTINKYMLTYKVDGEVYKQYEVEYNATITPETEPTKEGYTFSGWSEIPATMPADDVEVNGTFTINQYKVVFVVDGVTVKEETLDFGSAITAPENPTKTGHTFTGWNPAVDITVPAHDVTYVAQFAVNQYTITFDTDGGSEIAPITQNYNSVVTAPANPTKTGYTFAGWDKEIPTTMPAENITIKALWTVNKYMLTYKVDGEVYKQHEVEYNATITPETEPTKEGYTFSGWSAIPETMPAHDVEVTGSFCINQYKVTFISEGVVLSEETLDFGSAITAPENPTKIGHTFTGWNPAVDATVPAHDVIYVAQFTINQYTITFDTDGGSEIAPITQDYNSVVTAPANPTKTGYTFAGWDKEIPATMPAENITIKALWTINKYMLTYKVDGEVYKQYEVEYNAAITPETGPTKEGYTFSGWSEIPATMPANDIEINGTFRVNKYLLTYKVDGEIYHQDSVAFGSAIVLIDEPVLEGKTFSGWKGAPETMPAHDVTIVGSFNSNVYTLTYKVDGEVYKSVQYEFGENIIPEPEPTKEGHTFSGWSAIPETMPAHDVEVTGSFSINQYKVTFISEGVVLSEETLDYGSAITAPENPTKIGHTFTGWNPAVDATVPAHDVTYVAQFTINQYTITFDTDGGSEIAPITQDYNSVVTAPANPTKTGYTFAGWDKEIPATMPAENITIKALWTINKYMLTYKVDGEVYKQYEVEYNATITPETGPTKEGYTFSGWSEIPATMPANDIEINGTFSVNKYLLTYKVDGEIYHQDSVAFGSAIVLIDEPVLEGKTFSGWKGAPETMPAHDVTIVGSFNSNVYTLTYKVDGEVYKSVQYEFGENILPEAEPTKEGHTFSGWSAIPETMPAHDVEVTGSFSINQYKVTFISEGVVLSEETLDFGSFISAPEDPTKIGHTFAGWNPAVDSTVPAHDVTYTAQFSINRYKLIYMVDGEKYKEYEIEYSSAITPEAAPEKEGHTFSGWSEIPATMPANDVEVNGTFSVNQYNVTFMVDGEIIKQEQLDFGSEITAPDDPMKMGYTFIGWNPAVDATVPAYDVTYEAMFAINTYKLTYYVDGDVYKEFEIEFGTEIIPEENPVKEGYDFSGWSEIPQFMPDHNVEVFGTFTTSTGINSVKSESNNEKVYDLSGNRMTHAKKGINIINGKKIMIR